MGTFLSITNCKFLALRKVDDILLEYAAFSMRAKLDVKFTKEVEAVAGHVDDALMRAWNRNKIHMKECTWVSSYSSSLSMLLSQGDIDVVVASNGNWDRVQPTLVTIANSSKVGKTMFGFALKMVNGSGLEKEMKEQIEKLEEDNFSESARSKWSTWTDAKICAFETRGMTMQKRQCAWDYYGMHMQWELEPRAEMEMSYGVALREAVLGREDGVPLFSWEKWMFEDYYDFSEECEVCC